MVICYKADIITPMKSKESQSFYFHISSNITTTFEFQKSRCRMLAALHISSCCSYFLLELRNASVGAKREDSGGESRTSLGNSRRDVLDDCLFLSFNIRRDPLDYKKRWSISGDNAFLCVYHSVWDFGHLIFDMRIFEV